MKNGRSEASSGSKQESRRNSRASGAADSRSREKSFPGGRLTRVLPSAQNRAREASGYATNPIGKRAVTVRERTREPRIMPTSRLRLQGRAAPSCGRDRGGGCDPDLATN
jgi:hypothetical protein